MSAMTLTNAATAATAPAADPAATPVSGRSTLAVPNGFSTVDTAPAPLAGATPQQCRPR